MKGLHFYRDELVNLESSLFHEYLLTDGNGGYSSSTIIQCPTRKYHGLFVAAIPEYNDSRFIFLSSIEETIIGEGQKFHLGIKKYAKKYYPQGHKYIEEIDFRKIPTYWYKVGDIILKKEILMPKEEHKIFVRYTVEESSQLFDFRLRLFLSFRRIHELTFANNDINKDPRYINQGVGFKLYKALPEMCVQTSKKADFFFDPTWYFDIKYLKEKLRGYPYIEDNFVPGYLQLKLKKGDSFVLSASLQELNPKTIEKDFDKFLKKIPVKKDFRTTLLAAAKDFLVTTNNEKHEVIAGYPWFSRWGRDTFIALPGLTLYADGNEKSFTDVMDTMVKEMKNGLFPNIGRGDSAAFNSIDAPLWFIRAVQHYAIWKKDIVFVWKKYGEYVKQIIDTFVAGVGNTIGVSENGLLWAYEPGKALTWMDAIVNGNPVTPRYGYAVEINALWYNALCFAIEAEKSMKKRTFVNKYQNFPVKIEISFLDVFWLDKKGYLADSVHFGVKDMSLRPNQIFAIAFPYSLIKDKEKELSIFKSVRNKLLTPKGLRTLSPEDPAYKGLYEGVIDHRDIAYHQGTVWPWLIRPYVEAALKFNNPIEIERVQKLMESFKECICDHGVGYISEVYDGDPPHKASGSIAQAWSISAVLRALCLVESFLEKHKQK
ncbi:MAG: amylo-alpha-1,6-glucosidase [Chitinophagaceae bacterium]